MSQEMGLDWKPRLWAVVRYELLWNLRKKKLLGVMLIAFGLATLSLALPVVLSGVTGHRLGQNPHYVIDRGLGIGGFGMFLFAVAVFMNSISGEFESGTIIPLLAKPISRRMVFLGKLLAALLTLLSAYALLILYTAVGGTLVYGPQKNLHLLPLILLGTIIGTMVHGAIVLAIGSVTKSSLLAALGAFGVFLATTVSAPILSMFTEQAWVLNYVPGSGATGYIVGTIPTPFTPGIPVASGTDGIPENLVKYALNPTARVTYVRVGEVALGQPPRWVMLYQETLSLILARSLAVALTYILLFLAIAWLAFRRAQIVEAA